MKKMPLNILISAFLNFLVGIGLLIFKIPYGAIPIVLFILFFIPRAWSRGLAIGICALIAVGSLIWIFVMIAIGETLGLILLHAAVALFTGLLYLSFLFTLFTNKVRPFYIRNMFTVDKDDLGPEGWMCPQCNAKNKYSLNCWNCGYSKEEFLSSKEKKSKKKIASENKQGKNEENDKIEKYKEKKIKDHEPDQKEE